MLSSHLPALPLLEKTTTRTKDTKPPKEKKVYYSSRGGAGRSKSVGPATRKPVASSTPSKVLEVPVPTNKTTSTGRGGAANGRTFVVEEGTFERVMEYESGKILAMKSADTKRKTMSLRGGAGGLNHVDGSVKKKGNPPITPTDTQISSQNSEDALSAKSFGSRFTRIPSLNFSRERPPSPDSVAPSLSSRGSIAPSNAKSAPSSTQSPTDSHCPTCQCWRHAPVPQIGLDFLPSPRLPPSPSTSSFRAVFPGVLLYVPENRHSSGSNAPPSPTTSSMYHGCHPDSRTSRPEGESAPGAVREPDDSVSPSS